MFNFVHLRIHSEFSITDSIIKIDEVIKAAIDDRQKALALTDLSNLFGLIKFYKAARNNGIKPILGCDSWITNENDRNNPSRILLLIKNEQGYLNLCELLTRAFINNQHLGRAEINKKWFEEGFSNGLLAISGAQNGDIGIALSNNDFLLAKNCAKQWSKYFQGNFYIELQRYNQSNNKEEEYIQQAVSIAAELGLPVVATHPIQFINPNDFIVHEARVCIANGDILDNPKRCRKFVNKQYFLTQGEMIKLFYDIPSAIINTIEISKRCNLILKFSGPKLPKFPLKPGKSINSYFINLSSIGLERRLLQIYQNNIEREYKKIKYIKRMKFECEVIIKMGFASYFLIVADFVNWAKTNNIPVGPGRGSGASSLVAYSLGITNIDPLQYNLLFERFLNPDRVTMPDFDIDFCQEGRDLVIQYAKKKYGIKSVSQIITFGTMAAKAAIRDVGRVLGLGYSFTDNIAKLIPFKPGKNITISDAIKAEPILQERMKNEEEVHQLITLAQNIEGIIRNVGMHAGGILIAPNKLTDFCPLYTQNDTSVLSQYDKDDIEEIGLVKFDFLGLTTLTVLNWTEKFIKKINIKKKSWSISQIHLNDSKSFETLKSANTIAIFQLESFGMKSVILDAKPDCFEDIVALVALYRPGPMDLIKRFYNRKNGREIIEYPDPRVECILKETYGIMIYQEQVMQMAQLIGGYSLGYADLLRRAIGKKKPEEMLKHRKLFCDGASKNGLNQQKANEIFNLIEKFAGYGFNKSHAVAYAQLTYYTAWMKSHYPVEFMAANMSLSMDNTDRIKILFEDCIFNKITVLKPDINSSTYYFEPIYNSSNILSIRYGLGAIKGSGKNAIDEIVRARKDGPFLNLFNFCLRTNRRIVNKRIIESMICSGAFDLINNNRNQLISSISSIMDYAEYKKSFSMQSSFFQEMNDSFINKYNKVINATEWSNQRKLQEEKNVLGFCFSGHFFNIYEDEVRKFVKLKINDIQNNKIQLIAGIIESIKIKSNKNGKIITLILDDNTGQCEVIIFKNQFKEDNIFFKNDSLLIVEGKAKKFNLINKSKIIANVVMDLERARNYYAKLILINSKNDNIDMIELKKILLPFAIKINKTTKNIYINEKEKNFLEKKNREFLYKKNKLYSIGLKIQILIKNKNINKVVQLNEIYKINLTNVLIKTLYKKFSDITLQIIY